MNVFHPKGGCLGQFALIIYICYNHFSMTVKDFISYWLNTASEDFETAGILFKSGKYHHALFFCHLALEKLLKGLVYKKTASHPLPIHNLVKLAHETGIILTEEQRKNLTEMTSWNIRARYDSYKREFYKKATADFTASWFLKTKELFLWFKKQY